MPPSHVLAVMGVTGSGKSSFIKLVTGDPTIKVGHSQKSETKCISSHAVDIRGQPFTLVDTPGFDDLYMKDSDVLKMLVDWLTHEYCSGQKLSGILYLQRITDARMRGSSLRNLKMLQELVGDDFHKNVTLGTTCWSLVPSNIALEREADLKASTAFWKTLISKGARVERIPDDIIQARDLIYEIASHDALALQTQRDVVDLGKSLSSLTVAKTVDYELEELRKAKAVEAERLLEENRVHALQQEQESAKALERIQEEQGRIQEHQRKQIDCRRLRPAGLCHKAGFHNYLQHLEENWHCCSCCEGDDYWHCYSCGNNCGNHEHPTMLSIRHVDDSCRIL